MARIEIRDRNSRYIGWLEDNGSRISGYHVQKGYLGWYDRSHDCTYTKDGRIYCRGDGVASLVREAELM